MNTYRISPIATALVLMLLPTTAAFAATDTSSAVAEFEAYMDHFDSRYAGIDEAGADAVIQAEGERFATLYCRAIGIPGPCAPDAEGQYVSVKTDSRAPLVPWWHWLWKNKFNVGVIPNSWFCPAPYQHTVLHMDDSNVGNTNARGGWLGATLSLPSGTDTTWRLCKLDHQRSVQFKRLIPTGLQYDYAVQRLGMFCPNGSRPVRRTHGNVLGNGNGGFNFFPSVNAPTGWRAWTCHFDTSFTTPSMAAFPNLGIHYGVYASRGLTPNVFPVIANGFVRQDDVGPNGWVWNGVNPSNWVMNGGVGDTMRFLAQVQ